MQYLLNIPSTAVCFCDLYLYLPSVTLNEFTQRKHIRKEEGALWFCVCHWFIRFLNLRHAKYRVRGNTCTLKQNTKSTLSTYIAKYQRSDEGDYLVATSKRIPYYSTSYSINTNLDISWEHMQWHARKSRITRIQMSLEEIGLSSLVRFVVFIIYGWCFAMICTRMAEASHCIASLFKLMCFCPCV